MGKRKGGFFLGNKQGESVVSAGGKEKEKKGKKEKECFINHIWGMADVGSKQEEGWKKKRKRKREGEKRRKDERGSSSNHRDREQQFLVNEAVLWVLDRAQEVDQVLQGGAALEGPAAIDREAAVLVGAHQVVQDTVAPEHGDDKVHITLCGFVSLGPHQEGTGAVVSGKHGLCRDVVEEPALARQAVQRPVGAVILLLLHVDVAAVGKLRLSKVGGGISGLICRCRRGCACHRGLIVVGHFIYRRVKRVVEIHVCLAHRDCSQGAMLAGISVASGLQQGTIKANLLLLQLMLLMLMLLLLLLLLLRTGRRAHWRQRSYNAALATC